MQQEKKWKVMEKKEIVRILQLNGCTLVSLNISILFVILYMTTLKKLLRSFDNLK